MYRASFRRKPFAVPLCKSIESAIQWFQIHHGITFVTIHNPAVYLSGARVSISPTLVPRLKVSFSGRILVLIISVIGHCLFVTYLRRFTLSITVGSWQLHSNHNDSK